MQQFIADTMHTGTGTANTPAGRSFQRFRPRPQRPQLILNLRQVRRKRANATPCQRLHLQLTRSTGTGNITRISTLLHHQHQQHQQRSQAASSLLAAIHFALRASP